MDRRLLSLLETLDDPASVAALAGADVALDTAPATDLAAAGLPAFAGLAHEGITALPRVVTPEAAQAFIGAIERLTAEGHPAAFFYLLEAPWRLGESLRAALSWALGHEYELVEDVWAWRVAPGARGWPPHRGVATKRFDRSAPEILNVWVALSPATADRACMHAVPLDDDPGYAAADLAGLARVDAPLEVARAFPIPQGDALAWNANLLHWGGPCSARAAGPRVSCSFTLRRADASGALAVPVVDVPRLDHRARADAVARQIVMYGEGQPDVSTDVLAWAKVLTSLAARGRP